MLLQGGHPPFTELQPIEIHAAVGIENARQIQVPHLQTGKTFELRDWPVLVLPLTEGVHGLLGGDVYAQMGRINLNYDAQDAFIEGENLAGQANRTA